VGNGIRGAWQKMFGKKAKKYHKVVRVPKPVPGDTDYEGPEIKPVAPASSVQDEKIPKKKKKKGLNLKNATKIIKDRNKGLEAMEKYFKDK